MYLILQPDAPRFTILTANAAYLRTMRRTLEELVGRGVFEAFPEQSEQGELADLRTSLDHVLCHHTAHAMAPLKYSLPRPIREGGGYEERYWKPQNIPLLAQDGTLRCIIHTTEDITQRIRAEQDRDRFFAVTTDLLVKAGLDGYLREVSPSCTKILGWTPAEVVGRPWREFVDHRDLATAGQILERVAGSGETRRFETRIRCKDGNHRWLRWNIHPVVDEGVLYAAADDVTQARRFQAVTEGQKRALEMSVHGEPLPDILDHLLRTLEENASSGVRTSILLLDPTNKTLGPGAAPSLPQAFMKATTGVKIGPGQGSCGEAAFTGKIYAAYDVATDPAWRGHAHLALNYGLRSCWSSPICSSSGAVLGTFALYYDKPTNPTDEKVQLLEIISRTAGSVIEREMNMAAKQLVEQQLIQARNAAEAANVAKSAFLANMSHEIRTPMNVVINIADILSRHPQITLEQGELVEMLQRSADSLLSLIDHLLDLSKIEAGSVELEQIPFGLGELIGGVADILSLRARQRGVEFRLLNTVGVPDSFVGDPARLRQIMLNLCDNALKFTPSGRVTVQVKKRVAPDHRTAEVRLRVTDTGIGIAPEQLESIFQPFTQAETTINRRFGGTGLGLAITRELVSLMQGSIEVKSTPGCGSTFTVTLPLTIESVSPAPPAGAGRGAVPGNGAETSSKATPPRILLVEDFEPNALIAGRYLRSFGYVYDVATTGAEALEMATHRHYAAILMDLRLPVLDGYGATAKIRQRERQANAPRTPIIALTAHALASDRQRCISAGMDDYLSKPFRAADLRQKLRQVLGSEV